MSVSQSVYGHPFLLLLMYRVSDRRRTENEMSRMSGIYIYIYLVCIFGVDIVLDGLYARLVELGGCDLDQVRDFCLFLGNSFQSVASVRIKKGLSIKTDLYSWARGFLLTRMNMVAVYWRGRGRGRGIWWWDRWRRLSQLLLLSLQFSDLNESLRLTNDGRYRIGRIRHCCGFLGLPGWGCYQHEVVEDRGHSLYCQDCLVSSFII